MDLNDYHFPSAPSAVNGHELGIAGPSAPPVTAFRVIEGESSAPAYRRHAPPPIPITDDKQELHRQRLEMERSAPEDMLADEETGATEATEAGASAPSQADVGPTAPSATDYDGFGFNMPSSHQPLPRYER